MFRIIITNTLIFSDGSFQVGFKVKTNNRVSSSRMLQSDDGSDSKLNSCVTGKIRRWKFPKAGATQAVDVKIRFDFKSYAH